MAGMSYPPWSAPSTMERDKKNKAKSKKWTNMKRAFMKPWQKKPYQQERSQPTKDRSALPPPAGLEGTGVQQMQFGEFSPFAPGRQKINPLSGGGNPLLFHQLTGGVGFPNYHPITRQPYSGSEEASPYEKRRESRDKEVPGGYFDPPTPKPSRPALTNIFPMYDSPKVQKTPAAVAVQQNKATKSPPVVKPIQPSRPLIQERRGSTPATSGGMPPNVLKHRHIHTSAQSTTSDITDERMGRRERTRRPSAIKMLPLLPSPAERSPPVVHKETRRNSDFDNSEALPSHAMYHTPANLAYSNDNGLLDSTGMYGWSQQPNEELQKLEEELEDEGPEGKEEDVGIMSWEKERAEKLVADSKKGAKSKQKKKKNGSKFAPKQDKEVTDFAQEFVRQLTIGGNEADVLY